jgi:hypothetical protein
MSTGYRKPPRGSRFKKGRSGNPKGPPKRAARLVSTAYLFRKVANQQVAIEVDGRTVMMTRWEALLRQIHTLALNKDAGAARLLHQIRKQFPGNGASREKMIMVFSDSQMKY